jgi:hypothetical protein
VLNNVNKQVKKSESSSSKSSDSDNDGRVDHTYNPYCFKNLEKAIFSKKKITDKKPGRKESPEQISEEENDQE